MKILFLVFSKNIVYRAHDFVDEIFFDLEISNQHNFRINDDKQRIE